MKLNHIIVAGIALLPLFLDAATPTFTSTRNDGLLRQELSQERIGTSLQRVARQLDSVIAEYDRNELEGDDVDTLKRFRGMLNNLTQSEVRKIVKQLENARLIQKDNTKASNNAFGAFAGQKQVTVQLQQIYLDWQRQQIFRELSSRFMRLSSTQKNNMDRTVVMADKPASARYQESAKIDLRLQELDQAGISDESASLVKKLEELNKLLDPINEPRPKLALEKVKAELDPALEGALTDIKGSRLQSAAGNERRARGAMIDIARILAPKRDKEEIIRQAIRDIEKTMARQEEVIKETKELKVEKDPKPKEVERAQADLVDRTDLIREDVANVVPQAAQELRESTDNQQNARAILDDNQATPEAKAEQAPLQQEEAIENLAEAKETLEEQLEKIEEAKNNPQQKDKLEQLKELAEKVAELKKREEEIKQDAAAAEVVPEPGVEQKKAAAEAKEAAEQAASRPRSWLSRPPYPPTTTKSRSWLRQPSNWPSRFLKLKRKPTPPRPNLPRR